jgi:CheY-like chemotaxis protein
VGSLMQDKALFLLVEDEEDQVVLLRRAFEKANISNPLRVVRSGEEAMVYLEGAGPYVNRDEFPLPKLVLLDLKMPGISGFDVLRWIRQQPQLQALRVVVLTASNEIRDVNLAYQLGANSFLVKPVEFDDFVRLTQAIQGYWIWLSKAPAANVLSKPISHDTPQNRSE